MSERLHQFRFDEHFQPTTPQDVTPAHFTGVPFPSRERQFPQPNEDPLGRYVYQVKEDILIDSPHAAAQYLIEQVYTPFEQFDQEETWVLMLNTKNKITHKAMVYRGTINTVHVRIAELFKEAVKVNAASILLSHNHPSGTASPSPEDIEITRQVRKAAELLGITLEDHIIVGDKVWTSLRSVGLGF
jgi:DNA repair protein RadC